MTRPDGDEHAEVYVQTFLVTSKHKPMLCGDALISVSVYALSVPVFD